MEVTKSDNPFLKFSCEKEKGQEPGMKLEQKVTFVVFKMGKRG